MTRNREFGTLILAGTAEEPEELAELLSNWGYAVNTASVKECQQDAEAIARACQRIIVDLRVQTLREAAVGTLRRRFIGAAWVGIASADDPFTASAPVLEAFDELIILPLRPFEVHLRLRIADWRAARRTCAQAKSWIERRRGERGTVYSQEATRFNPAEPENHPMVYIDEFTKEVYVSDEKIELTKLEYELLRTLASFPGRVFSVEELLRAIWPGKAEVAVENLQQYVYRLRRKLEHRPGTRRLIYNVKGFGYRLGR